jgi:hypothetical protein
MSRDVRDHLDDCDQLERAILALIESRTKRITPDCAEEVAITACNGALIALWIALVRRTKGARDDADLIAKVTTAIRNTPWAKAVAADVIEQRELRNGSS